MHQQYQSTTTNRVARQKWKLQGWKQRRPSSRAKAARQDPFRSAAQATHSRRVKCLSTCWTVASSARTPSSLRNRKSICGLVHPSPFHRSLRKALSTSISSTLLLPHWKAILRFPWRIRREHPCDQLQAPFTAQTMLYITLICQS